MRDRRFVAEHRGGPLCKADHYRLTLWGAACAERAVEKYWRNAADTRPRDAIATARSWARGEIRVGVAQKASIAAHAAARAATDPAAVAAARAAGHAVATAHMADHSLGGAGYALKAVKAAGDDVTAERRWQDENMPAGLGEDILILRAAKRI